MSDDKQEPAAADIEQQIEARWLESSLGVWMSEHYDQVEALFNEGSMEWTSAAGAFAAEGLRAPGGQVPDAATAEETWKRINALRRDRVAKPGERK